MLNRLHLSNEVHPHWVFHIFGSCATFKQSLEIRHRERRLVYFRFMLWWGKRGHKSDLGLGSHNRFRLGSRKEGSHVRFNLWWWKMTPMYGLSSHREKLTPKKWNNAYSIIFELSILLCYRANIDNINTAFLEILDAYWAKMSEI